MKMYVKKTAPVNKLKLPTAVILKLGGEKLFPRVRLWRVGIKLEGVVSG
uniref:Uncharacterized protein n=1 Tax=Anguilla anguilla TaxID=7936 RepID=A0A0E9TZ18_ANGAN